MQKLIVILGPTSSGKSFLAIKLARKFNGEIISADSRQVYKGMDLGSGKVTKAEQKMIKHYLLDVASPKKQFTVTQFKQHFKHAITQIKRRKKIPFLVGGSAFWIYSTIDDWQIPDIKPNSKLRKQLAKKSTPELFKILKKLDPWRAKNIDPRNPRRLIRAIEIVKFTKRPIPQFNLRNKFQKSKNYLLLGMERDQNKLRELISKRLLQRLEQGMIAEVKRLKKSGLSWNRLEGFGLEYKFIAQFLQKKISHAKMINRLMDATVRFAKRQMTWFKRDKRIVWINRQVDAEKLVKNFLRQ